MHDIKGVHEPSKGKESDSSKIACGFSEGSLAKGGCQNTQCTCCSARVHPRKVFHCGLPKKKKFFFSIEIFEFSYLNDTIKIYISPSTYPNAHIFI